MKTDQTRVRRALSESLFLLHQQNRTYHVMGSRGTSYQVEILEPHVLTSKVVRCECPDFTLNHHICKHIYFLLYRILNLPILDDFPSPKEIQNAYDGPAKPHDVKRVKTLEEDQECCICFEKLSDGQVVSCVQECGQSIHKECYQHWLRFGQQRHGCPLCRCAANLVAIKKELIDLSIEDDQKIIDLT